MVDLKFLLILISTRFLSVCFTGGMSETYADTYLKFHEDLNALNLDDTEMACLSAIAILSPGKSLIVVW